MRRRTFVAFFASTVFYPMYSRAVLWWLVRAVITRAISNYAARRTVRTVVRSLGGQVARRGAARRAVARSGKLAVPVSVAPTASKTFRAPVWAIAVAEDVIADIYNEQINKGLEHFMGQDGVEYAEMESDGYLIKIDEHGRADPKNSTYYGNIEIVIENRGALSRTALVEAFVFDIDSRDSVRFIVQAVSVRGNGRHVFNENINEYMVFDPGRKAILVFVDRQYTDRTDVFYIG